MLMRPLVSESDYDIKLRRQQAKIERLKRRQPKKASGKTVFFKEAVEMANEMLPEGSDAGVCGAVRQSIMRSHSGQFAALAPGTKEVYERKAAEKARLAFHTRCMAAQEVTGVPRCC